MFLVRVITYMKGFVRISVGGKFVERFLNICKNRNIYVWDVKNRGEELMHLNMTINGFKNIRPVAFKSKTRVKILSRHGLPFLLHKHKRRKAFLISAVVSMIFLLYLTSYVWVIDVEGNEKVKKEEIIYALKENGFEIGSFRYGKDIATLQNKMMLSIEELSWIWVDIRGTRAVVQVKEKTPVPQIVDRHQPCNIVASTDGIITEINATYGEKIASIGDIVKKGELLIGGISNTKYDGIHYLHSSGVVKARTWRSESKDFPLKKINFSQTGKIFSKKTINFFGFRVKLYKSEKLPFEYNKEETKVHYFSLGENFVFPVSVERNVYYELVRSESVLSVDQAKSIAEKELCAELDSMLTEKTTVINKTTDVTRLDEGQINVEVNYECIEEIGMEVPIEVQ